MWSAVKRGLHTVSQGRHVVDIPVGIIGAPFYKGTGKIRNRTEDGPSALRRKGLLNELGFIRSDIRDYGNIEVTDLNEENAFGKSKFPLSVSYTCQKLSESVQRILNEQRRCLVLGGDHSLGMGSVYGHSQVYNDLCILWIDAHADINTQATSMSGHIHGMPCSFLLKEVYKSYAKDDEVFNWIKPCLKSNSIAFIGLNDVDPMEKIILDEQNIVNYSMSDIDRLGIIEVVNRALEQINPTGQKSLHVSFDIDSIDKMVAPSTGTPLYGGLSVREVLCLAEEIYKRGMPSVVDIVEVDPSIGNEYDVERTLNVAICVTKALMGYSRSSHPMEIAAQSSSEERRAT